MQVIDLTPQHERTYFLCLEDWSDEMKEAGDHKETWYRDMAGKGLRVKLALDDRGAVGGMIEYLPIEHAEAEGAGLYFINCIWVHGHKQGVGNLQKRGMGTALLAAAEQDARALGAKGMAAFGLFLPFWIRASWFKKHGYTKVDSLGGMQLLFKPFAEDAAPPRWIRAKYAPELIPGKVTVTSLLHGRCPAGNMTHERARRAAAGFGDRVVFRTVRTDTKDALRRCGESAGLYVDNDKIRIGPPPSYERIRSRIAKRVRSLDRKGWLHLPWR
ncbi:MAG: GNAT family N-acetyltransferase [Gemmatimonadetes bacterium]|nr:GNAT family N-acetyltransferase [Gemmatimonadota bacterium]